MVYIFAHEKSQFGYIGEGLGMENVVIFFGHLTYFAAIWYVFWPFGMRYGKASN
jgi:hypothetical protein